MKDENEKLEQAGHLVTNGEREQHNEAVGQAKGMGGTDLRGEDSATAVASEESTLSDGSADEKKVDDDQADPTDVKKNPDPEPGVPDQDF